MDAIKAATELARSLRPAPAQVLGPGTLTVDPYFYEDAEAAKAIETAIRLRLNIALVGPPGCGKSSLAINVAARLGVHLEMSHVGAEATKDEVIGKVWVRGGDTVVEKGPALRAYTKGCGFLMEEWDAGQPDVMMSLHRIMEVHSNFYTSDIGDHMVFEKADGFFVIGASNSLGWGDGSFEHAGTKPQNSAFINRWSAICHMDYLPQAQEAKVLRDKTGVDAQTASVMATVAAEIRKAKKTSVPAPIVGNCATRNLIAWGQFMSAGVSIRQAAKWTIVSAFPESDRETVNRIIENRVR